MAFNILEYPNDFNLFCNSITTNNFIINNETNNYINYTFPFGLAIDNTDYTIIANGSTPTPWIYNSGALPGFSLELEFLMFLQLLLFLDYILYN